jgi:lysylphosphatidylglycerol synthetase-like protein (DUF2156 family)
MGKLDTVSDLVVEYGGALAHGLLEPDCRAFRSDGVEGVVGYRQSWRCAVVLGDPVCPPSEQPVLAARFRDFCAACGRDTVYAGASESLAAVERERGACAVEFGRTLTFDPRRDSQAGARGHELRKKVKHARRDGVVVEEYRPEASRDAARERAIVQTAGAWLAARHGIQTYVSHLHLFDPFLHGRRWFFARVGSRVVGVLVLVRMESHDGYLIQHLLAAPAAPVGVTELLVVECFDALAAEECVYATFGPAPAEALGAIDNLGRGSAAFTRRVYAMLYRRCRLGQRVQFQRKFQPASAEPVFLVFEPARVRLRHVLGVIRAFHVSLA